VDNEFSELRLEGVLRSSGGRRHRGPLAVDLRLPERACPARLVAQGHVSRALPSARLDELKWPRGRAAEHRRARAQHDRGDHQVQLVDQATRQQAVPERAAAEDQDVLARLAVQLGYPLVGAAARRTTRVLSRHGPVFPAARVSDTTTFSMTLLRRDISRRMGVASGSSATGG
jgi:hypothetical protein